ncbi:MAG: Gfo/Idh/MocA family oxidoreductase [Chloroflexi bacterium]|nr:Gfo/Idh/MocA family oxidoreductase [Chloroflexota bacterium]MYI40398.1 Gfo/Idh/MocA family oxidoreductase [Chloroflexota bacterium]
MPGSWSKPRWSSCAPMANWLDSLQTGCRFTRAKKGTNMGEKMRWGILSTANIGRRVIPAIHASRNGEAAAVGSRSLASAQAFAAEQNIPRAHGSYADLLADPDIDAIYIPLPNSLHAEWSIQCAQAGIPTLCEKPFASDAAEAQSILDAFAKRDVLLAEAFMYRFHPQHEKVKQIIADGGIGEMQFISSAFTFLISDAANIRLSKPLAGGALMDVGCYCVNLMRFMTGEEPSQATASQSIGAESGVDEALAGALHFPGGTIGNFHCGLRAYREHSYTIKGTAGMIRVPTSFVPDKRAETIVQHWRGDDYSEHRVPPVDHYQLMVEDFADALLGGRAPRFSAQDAVANMRVIDKLLGRGG